ncbi:hypothetical protein WYO_1803 [Methylobacterium sp. GXF4]|uniref:hypothetical protein n=1 Tax=Methylobacterium sp. GXF4 TaxID=1096546 RepID=UPI0002697C5C|nr:hypothetical protein [Methylobacterium sp. GXF4]EIZ85437.1 hypothetical protein WYO_1803 [Methylobacterium sp. GXF4]
MTVLRIKEVIERGPFGRTKLYADIAAGRLVTRKIGGSRIVLESDWNDYLRGVSRAASAA